MKKLAGKRLAVIAGGLSVVLAASVAFAAWTATGGGSGNAKASTASPLTTVSADVSAFAAPDALYPGDNLGKAKISIHNPNPYGVDVTNINYDGTGYITSTGGLGTCDDAPASVNPTGVTFHNQGPSIWHVNAGATATFTLAAGSVTMDNTSDNNCQGATFTIPVTLAGVSNP